MSTAAMEMRWALDTTSPQRVAPTLLGWASLFVGLGTSAGVVGPQPVRSASHAQPAEQTSPGLPPTGPGDAGAAIGELRRLTGLSWDQLASLFGVSRRSLHFWASGKAMTPAHEARLRNVLAFARAVDRGTGRETHDALFEAGPDGTTPFSAAQDGDLDRAFGLLGPGRGRLPSRSSDTAEVLAARRPPPPDELVGALHDRVHVDLPGARRVRSVKRR